MGVIVKTIASTLLFMQAGMTLSLADDVPGPQNMKVNDQQGPWILTSTTMPGLLKSGFDIVGIETLVTLSGGVTLSAGAAIAVGINPSVSKGIYDAYYLKKERNDRFYRCTEEGNGATTVYCWLFHPKVGTISGISQKDAPENILLGKWTGTVVDQRPAPDSQPTVRQVQMTFDEKTATSNIPDNEWPNLPVTYNVEAGDVRIVLTSPLATRPNLDFKIESVNRIKVHFDEYGDIILDRVDDPVYTTESSNSTH